MSRRCPGCGKKKHRQSKLCRKCFLVKQATPEARENLSKKRTGQPSYVRTEETRRKLSQSLKGKKHNYASGSTKPEVAAKIAAYWTEEVRERFRQRGKQLAQDPEWIKKVSSFGPDNPMWRGGACEAKYTPGFSTALKTQIRERDEYTCQLCGITESELGYVLSIHHIDYSKDNHDPHNLASTCKACNSRVNTNEEIWLGYFTTLADARRQFGKDVLKFIGRKVFTQHKGYAIITHDGAINFAGTIVEDIVASLCSS